MDLVRAVRNGPPFSDEGQVALAITQSVAGRASVMLAVIAAFFGISILAARNYPLANNRAFKVASIYILSLIVGIGIVLLDELLGLNR